MTFVWRGVHDTALLQEGVVLSGHRFADAAKAGDWSTVFEMLDDPRQPVDINSWRPRGTAWFTVLHQAAWHGAPNDVVNALIQRGALRSLPDSKMWVGHRRGRIAKPPETGRALCYLTDPGWGDQLLASTSTGGLIHEDS